MENMHLDARVLWFSQNIRAYKISLRPSEKKFSRVFVFTEPFFVFLEGSSVFRRVCEH